MAGTLASLILFVSTSTIGYESFEIRADALAQGRPIFAAPASWTIVAVKEHGLDVAVEIGDQSSTATTIDLSESRFGREGLLLPPGATTPIRLVPGRSNQTLGKAVATVLRIPFDIPFGETGAGSRKAPGATPLTDPIPIDVSLVPWLSAEKALAEGRYDDALILLKSVRDLSPEHTLVEADALLNASRYQDGLDTLTRIAPLARESVDVAQILFSTMQGLARVLIDYPTLSEGCPSTHPGHEDLLAAAKAARDAADMSLIGATANNLAAWGFICADRDFARDHLGEARDAYRSASMPVELASVLANLGLVLFERFGDYPAARAALHEGLQALDQAPGNPSKAYIYANLANLYLQLGDDERARAFLLQTLSSYRESGDAWGVAASQRKLGMLYLDRGDLKEAREYLIAALPTLASLGMTDQALEVLSHLMMAHIGLSEPTAAQELADYADDLLSSHLDVTSFVDQRAGLQLALAELALFRKDVAAAHQHAQAVIDRPGTAHSPQSVTILASVVALLRRSGATELAINLAHEVTTLTELQLADLDSSRLGGTWLAKINPVFDFISGVHAANYFRSGAIAELDRSFRAMERRRLINYVAEGQGKGVTGDLARSVSRAADRWASDEDAAEAEFRYRLEQERYMASAAQDMHQTFDFVIPGVNAADNLPEDTAALFFQFADPAFVVILHRARVLAVKLPSASDLAVPKPNQPPSVGDLERLGARIIAPALAELPADTARLLIATDDTVEHVPFAGLSSSKDRYRPLVADYELVHVSGARALRGITDSFNLTKGVVVVADPADPSLGRHTNAERGWSASQTPLPYARREAAAIGDLWPGKVEIHLGGQARLEQVISAAARDASILHFATHGFAHPDIDIAGLGLSDGLFTEYDLQQTRNNGLVFLNACSTQSGRTLRGQGSSSIAKAFLTSGAASVVATLWPVPDRSSSLLSRAFYTYLKSGNSLSMALRLAQIDVYENPRFRQPQHWAPFRLIVSDVGVLGFASER